ncbi:MAG TPA: hypothetical protein DCS17_10710 [Flavobacterium sp.]|nr:hypothetical protein [Flavobacterium sp.]
MDCSGKENPSPASRKGVRGEFTSAPFHYQLLDFHNHYQLSGLYQPMLSGITWRLEVTPEIHGEF